MHIPPFAHLMGRQRAGETWKGGSGCKWNNYTTVKNKSLLKDLCPKHLQPGAGVTSVCLKISQGMQKTGIKRGSMFQMRHASKITKIQILQTEVILVSCLLKYEVHYPKMPGTWISTSSKPESEWENDYRDHNTVLRPSGLWQIIPTVSLIYWAGQCISFHRYFTGTVCLLPGTQVDTIKIPQEGYLPPEQSTFAYK